MKTGEFILTMAAAVAVGVAAEKLATKLVVVGNNAAKSAWDRLTAEKKDKKS